MKLKPVYTIKTDLLIIGGGGAGLRAAIEARRHGCDVVIVSKSRVGYGNNTALSGAAFAAASGIRDSRDTPQVHLRDTVVAGCFLNNHNLVAIMTAGASQQVRDLEKFGVRFKRRNGDFLVAHVPGHTYAHHVMGDKPLGTDFTIPLRSYASNSGVKFAEGIVVTKLLKQDKAVAGALGIDKRGNAYVFSAKATILATGGVGEVYQTTNNAADSTGDGYILACDAGAQLQDMEFVQFYPTALAEAGKRIWPYEIFLSRGATLRNASGEDILEKHGIKDFMLMTRDMLTRAIMLEIIEDSAINGAVAVDLSTVYEDKREKLSAYATEQRFPEKPLVIPTAHFMMGGVRINEKSETGIERLYAAGEVCGGVHGANRLAGNALTEAFVFGTIAGDSAAKSALQTARLTLPQKQINAEIETLETLLQNPGQEAVSALRRSLRETMWYQAGIIRNGTSLETALAQVLSLKERLKAVAVPDYDSLLQAVKLKNMVAICEMIIRPALLRTESRGAHYRTDYPKQDDTGWLKNIVVASKDNAITLSPCP